jgi:hypothetical protein
LNGKVFPLKTELAACPGNVSIAVDGGVGFVPPTSTTEFAPTKVAPTVVPGPVLRTLPNTLTSPKPATGIGNGTMSMELRMMAVAPVV